jgi:hypothetical protein
LGIITFNGCNISFIFYFLGCYWALTRRFLVHTVRYRLQGVRCNGNKAEIVASMSEPKGAVLMPSGKSHSIKLVCDIDMSWLLWEPLLVFG